MHKLLDIIHKPPLIAIRTVLMFAMMMLATLTSHAQDGLAVNGVFQQYGHSKGCKMVVMQNTKLRGYRLAIYKSLTYNNKYAANINDILKNDRRAAKKIREVVDNGRITSGYYMMAPLPSGHNRYILFSNTDRGKGAVIYIEGNLSPEDIMTICYTKRW